MNESRDFPQYLTDQGLKYSDFVFGFGVIYKNGLQSFNAYKHLCLEFMEGFCQDIDDPESVTIEPVKVIFAKNGNVRFWTRNNRTI